MKRLLPLLLLLVAVVQSTQAQEPYAVLSDNNTKLTFYYDTNKESRNGMSVEPFSYSNMPGWSDATSSITTVVFDSSFANCSSITSTAEWFWHCYNLTTITGIENLKTSNVTDMSAMFTFCSSLTSLDLSHFDTSKVTYMSAMFSYCSSLTSLDVSNFDTSNVIDMYAMFSYCSNLTSLNVSRFNTSNVTNMWGMFNFCSKLKSLDVSGFDTSNVTDMGQMFSFCSKLTNLDVSNFNTSNVTNMQVMFSRCSSLTNLDVSNFNTSNVTSMNGMFWGCSSLTCLDLNHFDTSKVTDMNGMFSECSNLKSVTIGKNITKIGTGTGAFYECSNLNDVYCYADPKNLTWEGNDNSDCFKPQKGTLFHVYKKSDWEEKFPNANVTFVGDLSQSVGTNVVIREQSRLSSDGVFNFKGQRVSHPSKGLYVVNGKKVMIK